MIFKEKGHPDLTLSRFFHEKNENISHLFKRLVVN